MTTVAVPPVLEAFQGRIANCISALRLVEAKHPGVRQQTGEVIGELLRLHRDVAGLPEPEPVPEGSHAPGPRPKGAKRPCPAHNAGSGGKVSASRFRPGKSVCRECERRQVRIEADRITLNLIDGDACIGHACPVCRRRFKAGQRVVGVEIAHAECAP